MQIAGNNCAICKGNVVLSREGELCSHCGTVVHLMCEPRSTCLNCGQLYHKDERAKVDPLDNAILPRGFRTENSERLAAILVIVGSALIAFLLLWVVLAALIMSGLH
jgi:hypothetical protein